MEVVMSLARFRGQDLKRKPLPSSSRVLHSVAMQACHTYQQEIKLLDEGASVYNLSLYIVDLNSLLLSSIGI
jgi:hypothetical protein